MKPAFPAAATPRTPTETPPTSAIALKLNGVTVRLDICTLDDVARCASRVSRPHRYQGGRRSRHCGVCTVLIDGRRVLSCLTLAVMKDGAAVTTIEGLSDGGVLHPGSTGIHRPRRVPMRVLHTRPDLLSGRPDEGRSREASRRDPRVDERQHLPMRRVFEHRRGDSTGHASWKGRRAVNPSVYTRATDVASAVHEVAGDGAATFIAGGTNLIDLMKAHVVRPKRLVDITHLPLDRIEVLQLRFLSVRLSIEYRPNYLVESSNSSMADDTTPGFSRGKKCPAPATTRRATRAVNDARSAGVSAGGAPRPSSAP
jgi:FAD binding domain in molybdopterin dehydrogenase